MLNENVVVTWGLKGMKLLPFGLLVLAWKVISWLFTAGPFPVGLPAPDVNSRDCWAITAAGILIQAVKKRMAANVLTLCTICFMAFKFGYGIF